MKKITLSILTILFAVAANAGDKVCRGTVAVTRTDNRDSRAIEQAREACERAQGKIRSTSECSEPVKTGQHGNSGYFSSYFGISNRENSMSEACNRLSAACDRLASEIGGIECEIYR